jgi:hypothetical protein
MNIIQYVIAGIFGVLVCCAPGANGFAPLTNNGGRRLIPSGIMVQSYDVLGSKAFMPSSRPPTSVSLNMFDPSSLAVASSDLLSNENIKTAFSVATFLPQPFWFLLILIPNSSITKKIMGGYEVVTLLCLVHFFIVSASIAQPDGTAPMAEFSLVFDPAGDPQGGMMGMMRYPNFVSEEWSHVLTWDLFVGRWIWLDGLRRNVFTPHSVLLCNLIGPPGLLLHWATCLLTGKGIAPNEVPDEIEE